MAPTDAERIAGALTTVIRRARLPEVHERVAKAAGIDLDRGGYVVLHQIGDWGPLRISDLAERLGVTLPTASRHVSRLEARGYLDRSTEPDDARVCRVALSAAGRDAVRHVAAARRDAVADLLSAWPDADRADLARLLDRLVDTLTSAERDRSAQRTG